MAILYILLIPFAGRSYLRLRKEAERMHHEGDEELMSGEMEADAEAEDEDAPDDHKPPQLRSV